MKILDKYGFQKLSLADKKLFDFYYGRMEADCASTLSFASLIAWNIRIDVYYKVVGSYFCGLTQDNITKEWSLLPLIGRYNKELLEFSMVELISIMGELKLPIIFTEVSEWMLPYYRDLKCIRLKENYSIDFSDYIYNALDFMSSLNSKGNRYNYYYFIRTYNPTLRIVDVSMRDSFELFINEVWCTRHDCSECNYGCLKEAVLHLLSEIELTGAKGIVVEVNHRLVGYTIVSAERNQLIYHFKLNQRQLRGLDIYMNRSCYELFGSNCGFINYTEDMGLIGLGKYKQKLAKYELAHKYELHNEKQIYSHAEIKGYR